MRQIISILSMIGPDSRLRYLVIAFGVQEQAGVPAQPHLQGLAAAISWNRQGNTTDCPERVTLMSPVSIGCRSESSSCLLNSVNSSRKSTPQWARLISPGLKPFVVRLYPPTNPAMLTEWWTSLKGLQVALVRFNPADR